VPVNACPRGEGRHPHVALTFDDGPDSTSTPAFIAMLDQLGWQATFFMIGAMVNRLPGLAAEVAAAGHEVASHSYEHLDQRFCSPRAVRADIEHSVEVIADATGQYPRWFRPPYGKWRLPRYWLFGRRACVRCYRPSVERIGGPTQLHRT
jgi:peptidoglycan-N-acetylglucosamine deacetylase